MSKLSLTLNFLQLIAPDTLHLCIWHLFLLPDDGNPPFVDENCNGEPDEKEDYSTSEITSSETQQKLVPILEATSSFRIIESLSIILTLLIFKRKMSKK